MQMQGPPLVNSRLRIPRELLSTGTIFLIHSYGFSPPQILWQNLLRLDRYGGPDIVGLAPTILSGPYNNL